MSTNEQDNQGIPFFVTREREAYPDDYREWMMAVRSSYRQSQIKAAVRVNAALLRFYWTLGRDIMAMNAEARWGTGFLKTLSLDMQREFTGSSGLSYTNLKYARAWYRFYHERYTKGQQAVGELEMPEIFERVPWGHHIVIITRVKTLEAALFYVRKTTDEGMSRSTLAHSIDSGDYERAGMAVTNFGDTLPTMQGDLAADILKSPYNLDFMNMKARYDERDFEDKLTRHITEFLLELGQGFAYVGHQVELVMPSGKSYKPDMIFYHTRLHCYIVVELKVVDFEPEFAGKLNFYVSAVDELLRGDGDNPTIGLLICKHKDDMTVRWAFRGVQRPLGVAEYENEMRRMADLLPTEAQIKDNLTAPL